MRRIAKRAIGVVLLIFEMMALPGVCDAPFIRVVHVTTPRALPEDQ